MKAIKIASGVAVTALALAISAQANAAAHEGGDTEFSWSATGSMSFIYVNDFEASRMDVDLDEDGDFDDKDPGDGFGLETTLSIMHGPLSGDFEIQADDVNDGGSASLQLENLKVTEGAISFGMLDEMTSTHEYVYDMDESDDAGYAGSEGADTKAAIRYTMDGLKVQLEGQNGGSIQGSAASETGDIDTEYGLGIEYSGGSDALEYIVQGQIRGSDDDQAGDDAYTYAGAGVTYTADMFHVKAALNNYGRDEKVTELGFEVVATPIEAASVYVKGVNWNVSENDAVGGPAEASRYLFGATFTAAALTFTGEYELNNGDADDVVFGEVAYAQDMISGYASIELSAIEDSDVDSEPLFEAGVGYTTASGIVYAADYDFQTDAQNDITLSAGYAF